MISKRVLTFLLIIGLFVALVAISNPDNIAYPEYEHAHIRLSFSYNGVEENFASDKYQEGYSKDQCESGITKTPLHFHDKKNHILHLHWQAITGGQILKYYGLNKIDWFDSYIGIRASKDEEVNLSLIPIHAKALPKLTNEDKLWIYSGSNEKFELKSTDDFLQKDIETLLGIKSTIKESLDNEKKQSFKLLTANAHSTDDDKETKTQNQNNTITNNQEELKKINNLLGDIVIFAQPEKPSDEKVKEKFSNLEPLSESTCGG